jgi:predicted ATP-binding protein involved in virulence
MKTSKLTSACDVFGNAMSALTLNELTLINYRCFAKIEIDFHKQLTVLVAQNGYGKTSILDAIAIAFGPYVGAFDEAVGKHFHPNDIRISRVRETSSNEMEYASGGVELMATGRIPGAAMNSLDLPDTWGRALVSPKKSKTTIKDAKELIEYGKRMQSAIRSSDTSAILPVLAYYGTGRLWQMEKLTQSKLSKTSRTIGYTNCLESGSGYKTFAEWFRYWNISASEKRYEALKNHLTPISSEFDDFIDSISRAINICLEPSGWKEISYSASRQELVGHHDDLGELAVSMLSDGIRNMIGMVADIAFRATKLNPALGKLASEKTPGIVLIDEIDMHLHPEWQQVVLSSLIKAFPEMQFIVTTHSPQVLSTVHRDCIRILGKDSNYNDIAAKPVSESYGEMSSDVLESVMLVSPMPPVPEKVDLERLTALVDQGLYQEQEAQKLIEKLIDVFGGSHPHIQKLLRSIQRQEQLRT